MIKGLTSFVKITTLPRTEEEIKEALKHYEIEKIVCCCLGPKGTNIGQAAEKWIKRMGLSKKSEIQFFPTPEDCLLNAKKIERRNKKVVAVFWTCAVYSKESEFFFSNLDILAFFTQEIMPLDEMQLATRPDLASLKDNTIPAEWKIASHPSPQYLLKALPNQIVLVNSNSAAAKDCAEYKVEACITTEQARSIYKLEKLHSFGCPPMVFFGGITAMGSLLIKSAFLASHGKVRLSSDSHL